MKSLALPWNNLPTPETELSSTRVSAEHPHNFFWAKDSKGRNLLVLQFSEREIASKYTQKSIVFCGIKTDFRITSNNILFTLILRDNSQVDIFHTLCQDLLAKTAKASTVEEVLQIIFSRLERWRLFLSRSNKNYLTSSEVLGLFGELLFIDQFLNELTLIDEDIVLSWKGPLRCSQDFYFETMAVEVKSILSEKSGTIKISSEKQLESCAGKLYLCVYVLAEQSDSGKGQSLNDIVNKVKSRIADTVELDKLLSRAGYIDLAEYDRPCYLVKEVKVYDVKHGFPRLIREAIPEGIDNVTYSIKLKSISSYLCEFSDISNGY